MTNLYLAKKFMDGLLKLYGINQGFRKVFEFPSENMTNSFPVYRQTANSTEHLNIIAFGNVAIQLDCSNRDGWCFSHIGMDISIST